MKKIPRKIVSTLLIVTSVLLFAGPVSANNQVELEAEYKEHYEVEFQDGKKIKTFYYELGEDTATVRSYTDESGNLYVEAFEGKELVSIVINDGEYLTVNELKEQRVTSYKVDAEKTIMTNIDAPRGFEYIQSASYLGKFGHLYGNQLPVVNGSTVIITISAGTAWSTALAIVVAAYYGNTNIPGAILLALGVAYMGPVIDAINSPVYTKISELQLGVMCNNRWSLASFETTYYREVNGQLLYDYMSKGYNGDRRNFIQDAIVFAINNGYW